MTVSGKNIFLAIGRTLPFLYLSFFFIISIVEHTERSRSSTEVNPAATRAYSVVKKSIQDLKAPLISNIALVNSEEACPANHVSGNLFEWEAVDYCACLSSVVPGSCSPDVLGCREVKNVKKTISLWDGKKICQSLTNPERAELGSDGKWSCKQGKTLCANSGYCIEGTQVCPITAFTVQLTMAQQQTPNPLKNFFATGNFKEPSLNSLYASRTVGSSAINKIGVSLGSIPCVDPTVDPKRGYKSDLNILKRVSEPGCGTYGQSRALTTPLTQKAESEAWIENGHGLYFAELPGFEGYATGEQAILYAQNKPAIKNDAGCQDLYKMNDNIGFSSDNSGIFWKRSFVNIFTYCVVGVALVFFGFYFCLKQTSEDDSQQSLSYCTFWFIHFICIVLAITHIVVGALCMTEINNYQSNNEYLNKYSSLACFNDSGVLSAWKDLYSYTSAGLDRVFFWSQLSLWVSVAFLIIEFIYIIWYALGYKCSQRIEEEESNLISGNKIRS